MPRWRRTLRGMLSMGATFSAGVGLAAGALAGLVSLLPGDQGGIELIRLVAASAMWAFPIGVVFSGLTALTARSARFDELSMGRFAAIGAGAGLAMFGLLALNAWDAWTPLNALGNATILASLGAGSAMASLAIARRAGGDRLRDGHLPDELAPADSEPPEPTALPGKVVP